MTPLESAGAFAVAAGILTITPGLDTALVLRTAAVSGPRAAAQAGLGILLGLLVWGIVTAVGIGALLQASKAAYRALEIGGAFYLGFLGVRLLLSTWRRAPAEDPATVVAPRADRAFARGLLTNLLNPKVGVFYATFLPQFIPHGANVTWTSIGYAAIHMTLGVFWFAALILATRPLAAWLRRDRVQRNLDRATGVVFLAAGARLALDPGR
jgi:threonine/homoserine/homoserine lactone efflux protein